MQLFRHGEVVVLKQKINKKLPCDRRHSMESKERLYFQHVLASRQPGTEIMRGIRVNIITWKKFPWLNGPLHILHNECHHLCPNFHATSKHKAIELFYTIINK